MLKYLYKVLSKKDNFLSFLSITLVLIIVVSDVFGDGFNQGTIFEVILIILGLISLSQIVEREARFEGVNNKLEKIETSIEEITRPLFFSVNEVTPFSDIMEHSQELFYTGGHLHSFIHGHTNNFGKWLSEGKSLRLILQDPKSEGLKDLAMPCVNYNAEVYVAQINDSLTILDELSKKHPKAKLGVRVTNITPTQSVSIIDGHMGGTSICMLHHLPNGDSSSAPFMSLDPSKDKEWFELFYERYYSYLWNSSRVIISHPDDA